MLLALIETSQAAICADGLLRTASNFINAGRRIFIKLSCLCRY
jgi:hypothetical protein